MKRKLGLFATMLLLGVSVFSVALAVAEVEIKVSPAAFSLRSAGECVTVHTNIDFGDVDCSTLDLNGVAPYSTFADLQGDLVAKFDRVTIFAGVSPPEALLVFSGRMSDGTEFSASIVVRVKN